MKIYLNTNVFDESLSRIQRIFKEFPEVIVCVSGGKDSTVLYNLTLKVARKLNRLPLKVMFIDQEAEWDATINTIKKIMYNPEVKPLWYQMPIQISNATSLIQHWLWCWEDGGNWMREKDPKSIQENIYGETRFAKLFKVIATIEYKESPLCYLSGVRTEESPTRMMGLTQQATYKDITWGKVIDKKKDHITVYPLYDWSYTDIWKAIHSNKWDYNQIYKYYYMSGVPFRKMRISNLHHEKSVHQLFLLQEYEPETYERLAERLAGVDMAGKFGEEQYFIHNLPKAFKSWKEYRDYLTEKLLTDKYRPIFQKKFQELDILFKYYKNKDEIYAFEIQSILTNDWEFTKLSDYLRNPKYAAYQQYVKGKWKKIHPKYRKNIEVNSYGKLQTTS